MPCDFDTFAQTARSHDTELDSRNAVMSASVATLLELGRHVSGAAARRLADELPAELATPLAAASPAAEGVETGAFYTAVAAREGVDPTRAASHAQAVIRAIVACASGDAVRAVRDQLTAELSELFVSEREDHVPLTETDGPVVRTPPGPDGRPAFPQGRPNT